MSYSVDHSGSMVARLETPRAPGFQEGRLHNPASGTALSLQLFGHSRSWLCRLGSKWGGSRPADPGSVVPGQNEHRDKDQSRGEVRDWIKGIDEGRQERE